MVLSRPSYWGTLKSNSRKPLRNLELIAVVRKFQMNVMHPDFIVHIYLDLQYVHVGVRGNYKAIRTQSHRQVLFVHTKEKHCLTFNCGVLACVRQCWVGGAVQLKSFVTVAASSAVEFGMQGWAFLERILCVGHLASRILEASEGPTLSARSPGEPGALELEVSSCAPCSQLRARVRAQDDPCGSGTGQGPYPGLVRHPEMS